MSMALKKNGFSFVSRKKEEGKEISVYKSEKYSVEIHDFGKANTEDRYGVIKRKNLYGGALGRNHVIMKNTEKDLIKYLKQMNGRY